MLAHHLVGRAEELGSIEQVLTELDQGRARAGEVVGEAGIGKSRLLRELAARAEQRGHLVLSGSASELERNLPFSVFVDALDEYVEGMSTWSTGRLVRSMLGPSGFGTVLDQARKAYGERFADPVNDFRDVVFVTGVKP